MQLQLKASRAIILTIAGGVLREHKRLKFLINSDIILTFLLFYIIFSIRYIIEYLIYILEIRFRVIIIKHVPCISTLSKLKGE